MANVGIGTFDDFRRRLSAWAMALASVIVPVAGWAGAVEAAEPDWVKGRRFTVAFAQDNLGNDWRAVQAKQLRQALAPYPFISFALTDAHGDATRQIRDMEDFVTRRVNVLIASPQDGPRAAPIVSRAVKAGIPVVLLGRDAPGAEATTFVAPDNREIGRDVARFFAERSKNPTRILVLQGIPTASTAIDRTEGFREEINRHKHLGIAAIVPANYLRADAVRAMEDILTRKIPFDAIYAQSDSMAVGARAALRRARIDPATIPTIGIDYIREAREAIRDGEQTASYVYPTGAAECAEIVLRILKGEAVPKIVRVPTQRVTRDNVERIEPIF